MQSFNDYWYDEAALTGWKCSHETGKEIWDAAMKAAKASVTSTIDTVDTYDETLPAGTRAERYKRISFLMGDEVIIKVLI